MSGGAVVKRSVSIAGHATSVSLEQAFWDALRTIATEQGLSVQALIGQIDAGRGEQNLSSAIRVHVLQAVQRRTDAAGGERTGGLQAVQRRADAAGGERTGGDP